MSQPLKLDIIQLDDTARHARHPARLCRTFLCCLDNCPARLQNYPGVHILRCSASRFRSLLKCTDVRYRRPPMTATLPTPLRVTPYKTALNQLPLQLPTPYKIHVLQNPKHHQNRSRSAVPKDSNPHGMAIGNATVAAATSSATRRHLGRPCTATDCDIHIRRFRNLAAKSS